MIYRIVTENKNKGEIAGILHNLGLDFTMYPAEGSWKQVREVSLIIEFSPGVYTDVSIAAERIRLLNNQEAVLVQEIPSENYLFEEGKVI